MVSSAQEAGGRLSAGVEAALEGETLPQETEQEDGELLEEGMAGEAAVSFQETSAGQAGEEEEQPEAGKADEESGDMEGTLVMTSVANTPVSYTHLDVYKRQHSDLPEHGNCHPAPGHQ